MTALAALPPLLLPAPRRLDLDGSWHADADAACAGDPGLPAEGFRLTIAGDGIRLDAADDAGARHGRACLAQLRRQYGARLPGLRIDDWPAFAVRGVMLDIARDRIPTMAELRGLLRDLAGWRINHVQLYAEHSLAYPGHEAAWAGLDPLTGDEIRSLAADARALGIALTANQNLFGHLERWLELPAYRHLAEIQPGDRWRFGQLDWRTTPHSLCPLDPGSLDLVRGWLDHLVAWYDGPLLNLGGDETYDVGFGRSRAEVERRGRAAVYGDFVAALCAEVRARGRRPMLWADMALEHGDVFARFGDAVALCWGYEPDAPFARWLEALAGHEAWVCPGTGCWLTTAGRTRERRGNLLAAARDGLAGGARGYLATVWGDQGHRQPWPASRHALAEAAHRAWSGTAPFDPRASSLHAFADSSLAIGPWLDALGDADADLRAVAGPPGADGRPTPLRNRSALYHDLHLPWDQPWHGSAADWDGVRAAIAAVGPAPAGPWHEELALALDITRFAAERAVARRSGGDRTRNGASLDPLIARHRELWHRRARPGGWLRSAEWWERAR